MPHTSTEHSDSEEEDILEDGMDVSSSYLHSQRQLQHEPWSESSLYKFRSMGFTDEQANQAKNELIQESGFASVVLCIERMLARNYITKGHSSPIIDQEPHVSSSDVSSYTSLSMNEEARKSREKEQQKFLERKRQKLKLDYFKERQEARLEKNRVDALVSADRKERKYLQEKKCITTKTQGKEFLQSGIARQVCSIKPQSLTVQLKYPAGHSLRRSIPPNSTFGDVLIIASEGLDSNRPLLLIQHRPKRVFNENDQNTKIINYALNGKINLMVQFDDIKSGTASKNISSLPLKSEILPCGNIGKFGSPNANHKVESRKLLAEKRALMFSKGNMNYNTEPNVLLSNDCTTEDGSNEKKRCGAHMKLREIRAQAATERLLLYPKGEMVKVNSRRNRKISTLKSITMINCLEALISNDHARSISSLYKCPANIAKKLLSALMKINALTPFTLRKFIPVFFRDIDLSSYLHVTDDILHGLLSHRLLQDISLARCSAFTKNGLSVLRALPHLQRLSLKGCHVLQDGHLLILRKFSSLKQIILDDIPKITDRGIAMLCVSDRALDWTSLSICRCQGLTHRVVNSIVYLKNLKRLEMEGNLAIDRIPSTFKDLHVLTHLNLAGTGVNGTHLKNLPQNLVHVDLRKLCIESSCLHAISSMSSIASIELPDRSTMDDKALSYITGFGLKCLNLRDQSQITDEGLRIISQQDTRLSKTLIDLDLTNTKISDLSLQYIGMNSFHSLSDLELSSTHITCNGIMHIWSLAPMLRLLGLSSCWNINDDAIAVINNLKQLEILDLSRTNVTNEGVVHLSLDRLEKLNLNGTFCSESIRYEITGCPAIRYVSLLALRVAARSSSNIATEDI